MKKIIIKTFLLFWICSLSGSLWAIPQHVILTASQGTGSYIFANELSRLLSSYRKTNNSELVIRADVSAENRLTQLSNNRVSLAIIDAKTAHEQLKKHPGLHVLSVLWKNWLYVLGTVPGPFLSLESTQTLLVHDNSLYFAQVWKKLAPQSEITWFNGSSIPDFTDGFSEEVLAVTGPVPLREINNWLEQFAGIRLLALDQQLIRSLRLNFPGSISMSSDVPSTFISISSICSLLTDLVPSSTISIGLTLVIGVKNITSKGTNYYK